MWNLLNCYLSGRHEFGVWCEPGAIFLRCVHCGKRSPGWSIDAAAHAHVHVTTPKAAVVHAGETTSKRVLPFDRAVAR
jgi:hypothetical protein